MLVLEVLFLWFPLGGWAQLVRRAWPSWSWESCWLRHHVLEGLWGVDCFCLQRKADREIGGEPPFIYIFTGGLPHPQ